jgi:hypothetical protein
VVVPPFQTRAQAVQWSEEESSGSSVGVGGAGGVFGIGRGLFGSGGVGGTSISARIKSRPVGCASVDTQIRQLIDTSKPAIN